jgi:hypothetical protein
MKTTVQGPGTVSFWWKVSSEPSNDRLLFYVGSSERARITGEVDWQWRTFNLSSGSQTLRWTYSKNSSRTGGVDRAWVDQVSFAIVPPTITTQPVNTVVDPGTTARFTVAAAGTPTLFYRWWFNGAPLTDGNGISGSTGATLTIANAQSANAGAYSVVVSNSASTVRSDDAALQLTTIVSLNEAVDNFALTFATGGTGQPWRGQEAESKDGSDAAQTGAVGNSTYTWMRTTVSGPGTLSFWWKVSSERDRDNLRFMLDGSDRFRISGESNWHLITFSVPSGTRELQWRYSKNSSGAAGQDRGWVDQIEYLPIAGLALFGEENVFEPAETESPQAESLDAGPIVSAISRTEGEVLLVWKATPGKKYRVLYKENLADVDWIILAGGVEGIDGIGSVSDGAEVSERYYRIEEE